MFDEQEPQFGDYDFVGQAGSNDVKPLTSPEVTVAQARSVESECNLPYGTFAPNRKMTAAEMAYLSVPDVPSLAFHVDLYPGSPALILLDRNTGDQLKPYLRGAELTRHSDRQWNIENLWAGLVSSRTQGHREHFGEILSVCLNGVVSPESGTRFSWSIRPESISNIFTNAPRALLLGPKFVPIPAASKDEPSPGLCIDQIKVVAVVQVFSIVFQGNTTLIQRDAASIRKLAKSFADTMEKKHE